MDSCISTMKTFPTLLELLNRADGEMLTQKWWGPVLGADEGQFDGTAPVFEMTVVQDETGDESDVRLKCDVRKVGSTVYGLPLYRFRYTGRDDVYEGVMAQDVLGVIPSAVTQGADGHYRVRYDALGIKMRQIS